MSHLLLIGGTGFFGKCFLDAYSRGLLSPWNINRLTLVARHASNFALTHTHFFKNTNIQAIDGDISCMHELPFADYVIHAAASSNASKYIFRPDVEQLNIETAVSNYIQLAQKYHRESRIVYISSGAVYGKQKMLEGPIPESRIHDISHFDLNKKSYAWAKRNGELLFQPLASAGLNVAIARCFAFMGPWLPTDQHFAIGNFIRNAFLQQTITVLADRPVYRSYMYADDLVHWLMTIAEHADSSLHTYNVGSDQPVGILEAAHHIANIFGLSVSAPNFKINSVDDADYYVPCIGKARHQLHLDLQYDFFQSIDETIRTIQI